MLDSNGVQCWQTMESSKLPIQLLYKTMGQILHTIFENEQPTMKEAMNQVVDNAISSTICAIQCASSTLLMGHSPMALVFGRDLHLNISNVTDIIAISHNQPLQTNLCLMHEKSRHSQHSYQVREQVLVKNHFLGQDKLKPAWVGPYQVFQVHPNGTLTIE